MRQTERSEIGTLVLAIFCGAYMQSNVQAERVGFAFQGSVDLNNGSQTVFKVSVPNGALVTGTFSYDTTATGVPSFDGTTAFRQLIEGGFTLNFDHGALRISASDYTVTVGNDFLPSRATIPIDYLGIDYRGSSATVPPPLVVNDVIVQSAKASLDAAISWDSSTWSDLELPTALSFTTFFPYTGFAANSAPKSFTITSISAIPSVAGDYNLDGKFDVSDSVEWRKAFGTNLSYADGNANGVVDAADYVLWRSAHAAGAGVSQVPEPPIFALAAAALLILVGYKRERILCGQFV